jgi:hypothetical protein
MSQALRQCLKHLLLPPLPPPPSRLLPLSWQRLQLVVLLLLLPGLLLLLPLLSSPTPGQHQMMQDWQQQPRIHLLDEQQLQQRPLQRPLT